MQLQLKEAEMTLLLKLKRTTPQIWDLIYLKQHYGMLVDLPKPEMLYLVILI